MRASQSRRSVDLSLVVGASREDGAAGCLSAWVKSSVGRCFVPKELENSVACFYFIYFVSSRRPSVRLSVCCLVPLTEFLTYRLRDRMVDASPPVFWQG